MRRLSSPNARPHLAIEPLEDRTQPAGGLDPAFGTGGLVLNTMGTSYDWARDLVVQPNGMSVVVGTVSAGEYSALYAARFNADGSADTAFGTAGVSQVTAGLYTQAEGVALQGDKVIVAGTSFAPETFGNYVLVRFNPDGSPDPMFGTNGRVVIDLGGHDVAHAVAVDALDRIIVTGESWAPRSVQSSPRPASSRTASSTRTSVSAGLSVHVRPEGSDAGMAVAVQSRRRSWSPAWPSSRTKSARSRPWSVHQPAS